MLTEEDLRRKSARQTKFKILRYHHSKINFNLDVQIASLEESRADRHALVDIICDKERRRILAAMERKKDQ